MKQKWYHYTKWEDFQNGMYDEVKEGREERVQMAIFLLTEPELLYEYMTRVTTEWTHATEQNFTDKGVNHQAFLGQTACNLFGGIKEDETREAWGHLSNEERYRANKIADRVYLEWCEEYKKCEPTYQMKLWDKEKT